MQTPLEARLNALDEMLGFLIEAAEIFYETQLKSIKTIVQKIDFLRTTPFYPAIELCISSTLDLWVTKYEINDPPKCEEEIQEEILALLTGGLILKRDDILEKYVALINWTSWHPLESGDMEYNEVHKRLVERFPSLAQFKKPSH